MQLALESFVGYCSRYEKNNIKLYKTKRITNGLDAFTDIYLPPIYQTEKRNHTTIANANFSPFFFSLFLFFFYFTTQIRYII